MELLGVAEEENENNSNLPELFRRGCAVIFVGKFFNSFNLSSLSAVVYHGM